MSSSDRLAYFGPRGTFTEQAARALAGALPGDPELVPAATVPLTLAAVRGGDAVAGCVPVENSVEGAVSATMDALAIDEPLVAIAEHVLPVRFAVLVRPGLAAADVRTVASHPHALAQVQRWLAEHLPNADQLAANSTAAAAVGVVDGGYDAAVTAPVAVGEFPLEVLAENVADVDDAVTRFLLLTRPGRVPAPSGADRTSLVVLAAAERTGVLAEILTELALREINLSRIESRPLKGRFGEYRFYLDFDGHIAEERVGDALAALHRRCQQVRFLGSYPKSKLAKSELAIPAVAGAGYTDADYLAAAEWLAGVRRGVRS